MFSRFGVTSLTSTEIRADIFAGSPPSAPSSVTMWLENSSVLQNGAVVRTNYSPSLDRLAVGDRLAVKRTADGSLRYVDY